MRQGDGNLENGTMSSVERVPDNVSVEYTGEAYLISWQGGEVKVNHQYEAQTVVDWLVHDKKQTVEIKRLEALISNPVISNFLEGVKIEIPFQEYKFGSEHDAGKLHSDWYWLLSFLAGKAMNSAVAGDIDKAKHHIITAAAALGNWFKSFEGSTMRPGAHHTETKRR